MVGVAATLRVIVALFGGADFLVADMIEYQARAVHLVEHGTLFPDAFRVPVYPMTLAAVYSVTGPTLVAARLFNAALGVALVLLTDALARRLVSARAALVATAIVAVYPAYLLYPSYLMAENVFIPLVVLTLLLVGARSWAGAAAAGAAAGVAVLTRGTGLALVAGVAAGILTQGGTWRARALRAAAAGALFLAVTAPWIARNYAIYGTVVPVDTSSGYNFLLGFNPGANGRYDGKIMMALSETAWKGAPNDAVRSAIGFSHGLEYIGEHPRAAIALSARKLAWLWGLEGREHIFLYAYGYFGPHAASVVRACGLLIVASFPLLVLAAVRGVLDRRVLRDPALAALLTFTAALSLLHIASFGESRFHLPLIPGLAVLAARGLDLPPMSARQWVIWSLVALAAMAVWAGQLPELWTAIGRMAHPGGSKLYLEY